jgi:hypothetical protein
LLILRTGFDCCAKQTENQHKAQIKKGDFFIILLYHFTKNQFLFLCERISAPVAVTDIPACLQTTTTGSFQFQLQDKPTINAPLKTSPAAVVAAAVMLIAFILHSALHFF